ncbi:peptidylprolyl isomerase [Roseovarius pelagicus]|uniref:Parvulin-like PPIase n=1 Tax=Roseovarius pelagicus TaxID=2980108 RepID=A0ABY6D704_9RHOB|nr:peptidyl-prolyl cis-trans isomerase [Roseovarius pelagicus]UXX81927.1 peptidyl-prolyl cis-trans isomerase [Roseovarius pelagicus]
MFNRLQATVVATLLAAVSLAPPAWADDAAEGAPTADTVVATVDGTEITLGHMIALRAGLPEQFSQLPAEVLYKGILDQLVQQTLLQQNMTANMSKAGQLALENETRAVAASEEIARITGVALTDAALKAAFDEKYLNMPEETEYKAAHILVETEEEAKALVTELNDGGDFAALAKEHSTGPSGPSGGELGWFAPGMMVEPFQDAVEQLEAGGISDPVQTQFGWHVILLSETRTKARPDMEEVRPELEEELRQAAMTAHIEQLLTSAKIDRTTGDALDPATLNQFDLLEE